MQIMKVYNNNNNNTVIENNLKILIIIIHMCLTLKQWGNICSKGKFKFSNHLYVIEKGIIIL